MRGVAGARPCAPGMSRARISPWPCPRQRDVELAADHERRTADRGERRALVHVADRGAAAGVADGIGGEQRAARVGDRGAARRRAARGEKKRPITSSAIADMPPSSTVLAARLHPSRRRAAATCWRAPAAVTRSGACAASHCPIIPPSDRPQNANAAMPSASASASTSRRAARRGSRPAARSTRRGRGCRSAGRGSARRDRDLRIPHAVVLAERMRQHEHRRVLAAAHAVERGGITRSISNGIVACLSSFSPSSRRRNASALPR